VRFEVCAAEVCCVVVELYLSEVSRAPLHHTALLSDHLFDCTGRLADRATSQIERLRCFFIGQ